MLNKPAVQTYFSGNREYARQYLPDAFRILENYLRSAEARGERLAIDKIQRHLKGAAITIRLHHTMATITIDAWLPKDEALSETCRKRKKTQAETRRKGGALRFYPALPACRCSA